MYFVDRSVRDFYKGLLDARALNQRSPVRPPVATPPPARPIVPRYLIGLQLIGGGALMVGFLGVVAFFMPGMWLAQWTPDLFFNLVALVWCVLVPGALAGLLLVVFAEVLKPRRPRVAPQRSAPASLLDVWCQRVFSPGWQGRPGTTGAEGERRLYDYLAQNLGPDFYGISGLSLAPRSDIDLIVLGPAGIWVLDSKYWSETVTYSDGEWQRVRRDRLDGGNRLQTESVSPLDVQIQRVCFEVAGAISDGTGRSYEDVLNDVRGIVVFTHPRVYRYRPFDFPVVTEELTPALIQRFRQTRRDGPLTRDEIFQMIEALCNRDRESQGARLSGVALAADLARG